MKQRLVLLNVALTLIAALLGYQIRRSYQEVRTREQRVLNHKPTKPAVRITGPGPIASAVSPAQYNDVAQKMLFVPDRNANVVPDPVTPPPPKPVPPFPVAHGVILFGDLPPTVILSEGKKEQKGYKVGDKVGDFTIASIDNTDIVFTWDDKEFRKAIAELVDRSTPAPEKGAPEKSTPATDTVAQPSNTELSTPATGSDQSKNISLSPPEAGKPGAPMGGNFYACSEGDTSPAGTVAGGLIKREGRNPLSPGRKTCYWEAAH